MVSFQFGKKFYRAAILWWVYQKSSNFWKTFSFESGSQKILLLILLLLSCCCYYFHLDDIEWNEVPTLTGCNCNNSWPLYLNFSNMIKLCRNYRLIENSKCQQLFILKKEPPKKHNFFIFLKSHCFVMGDPIDINVDVFWKTYVDFLKSMVLQIFPKYRQIYVNFDVKSRTKFNCPQNAEKLLQYFPFECNLQNSITAF